MTRYQSSMRILQINHQFPPFSRQGSELHCWQLSKSLAATDEVSVFHLSEIPDKKPRRIDRSNSDGCKIYHGIDGGHYARVANWTNPILQRQFRSVLDECRPEIIHFHNYLSLGDDLPTIAKKSGAAVVYTLHDYGLACPNHLLLRTDGSICSKSNGNFFQDCCPVSIRALGGKPKPNSKAPWIRKHIPPLSRWQVFANQQANPIVRALLKSALAIPKAIYGNPQTASFEEKKNFYLEHSKRIFQDVDMFISPSKFLLEKYVACGLDQAKVNFIRYGMRPMEAITRTPSQDGKLRFGFIGAFHAHKGLEILLEAFRGLGDRAHLHIHGSCFGGPVAESYWNRITQNAPEGFHFFGAYKNEDLERILSTLDVVIVPSIWFENSPFTIQEAFQSGAPVITSNIGGMAELVRNGIDGLHFQVGDTQDLKRCMLSMIENPKRIESMRANLPVLPDLQAQVAIVREKYKQLLARTAQAH